MNYFAAGRPLLQPPTDHRGNLAAAIKDIADAMSGIGSAATGVGQNFTIVVRPNGSDVTGDGSALKPFATYRQAELALPPNTGLDRYFIDITGIDERISIPHVFPNVKSVGTIREFDGTEPAGLSLVSSYKLPITVFATPTVVHGNLPVKANGTVDPLGNVVQFTIDAANVTWAADDLIGFYVRDSAGGLPIPIALSEIVAGDARITTNSEGGGLVGNVDIIRLGARLYSNSILDTTTNLKQVEGALMRIESDSRVLFAGINFENGYHDALGNPKFTIGLYLEGATEVRFSRCSIAMWDNGPAPIGRAQQWYEEAQKSYVAGSRFGAWFDHCHIHGAQISEAYMRTAGCTNTSWRLELESASDVDTTYAGRPTAPVFEMKRMIRMAHPVWGCSRSILYANDGSRVYPGGWLHWEECADWGTPLQGGISLDMTVGDHMAGGAYLFKSELGFGGGASAGRFGMLQVRDCNATNFGVVVMGGGRAIVQGSALGVFTGNGQVDEFATPGWMPGASLDLKTCTFTAGSAITLPDGSVVDPSVWVNLGQTRFDGARVSNAA